MAEARSVTRAAERLGLSKAAVSVRLKALERELALQLVNRSTRSLTLTDAGERLLDGMDRMLADASDTLANVRDLALKPTGRLRITASIGVGISFAAPLIPGFLDRYPEIEVELSTSQDIADLAAQGFDLGLRFANIVRGTDMAWPVGRVDWYLVASPGYLARRGVPREPADLAAHRCLLYGWQSVHDPAWRFSRNGQSQPAPVQAAFKANNGELLMQAALEGGGVTMLSGFACRRHVASGALVALLPEWTIEGSDAEIIFAVRPWSARVPRTVRAFVDYLQEIETRASPTA
ncbi:LysR family transcriptional regulator [Phreatobacter stygius]|uniref:LysR family transcriptional regulator n=1 Tax=Phreatobacter stygius TaxID=1940610 RepID=A0A4D7BGZ1_9HYPH|nr:LysR family transcriptional regulator [Phreatobacter stygius]QCI67132.1 LysR family transcriptional regulator [Phreatobacter stygius]